MRRNRRLAIETLQARQLLTTYFVDPIHGDDSAAGTSPHAAYETVANLVSYYSHSDLPANRQELKPGDEIVLLPGVHDFSYRYDQTTRGLFLRNVHGTADKPIVIRCEPGAMVRSPAGDNSELNPIELLQSSYINIIGLDISSYGNGIMLAETRGILLQNNYIHDVDGVANNNPAAIHILGSDEVQLSGNFLANNYDREKIGDQNNRHIVIFGSRDVSVTDNQLWNSEASLGNGIEYKHLGGILPDENFTFEVSGNVIINSGKIAVGTSSPNSLIHHNLLLNSGSIRIDDIGGTHQLSDEWVYNNTIVQRTDLVGPSGLTYDPTETPGYSLGPVAWTHNLVVDTRPYDHNEKTTVAIFPYGSEVEYQQSLGHDLFTADNNVYLTADQPRFNVFASTHGTSREVFKFADWQAAGFDNEGQHGVDDLDEIFLSATASQSQAGWYENDESRLRLMADSPTLRETGEQCRSQLHVVRVGGDNTSPLTIKLESSQPGELRFQQYVTIPAGQSSVTIELQGQEDKQHDLTEGIQLTAVAEGYQAANTWVELIDSPADDSSLDEPNSGVFQVPESAGDHASFVAEVTQRWGQYDNEFGIAYVDDAQGHVGNLKPSDPGWLRALMTRSQDQVVFASGVTAGAEQSFSAQADRYFVFYLVQDASTDQWRQANPNNGFDNPTNLFTSVTAANPDGFQHLRSNPNADGWHLAWEDLDFGGDQNFTDLVVQFGFADPVSPDLGDTIEEGGDTTPDPDFDFPEVPIQPAKVWTNPSLPADVNGDGVAAVDDVLAIIQVLLRPAKVNVVDTPTSPEDFALGFVDVNSDKRVDILDALFALTEIESKHDRLTF